MTLTHNKRPLLICALATFLGKPTLANNEDDIARCARISTVGDRIVCLESALRLAPNRAIISPGAAETLVPEPLMADPAEPVQDAVIDIASAVVANVPQTAGSVDVVDTREDLPEVTMATSDAMAQELGTEQVATSGNKGRSLDRIYTTIVAFDTVGSGKLRFWLDNGQVWRQIGDDDQNIHRKIRNSENIPVEMWQSRTGGYRMRILPIDRIVRIKRLK